MIGDDNYDILRQIKEVFDPNYIFNPGKIINPDSMIEDLRYEVDRKEPKINTFLNFDDSKGILRASEKCNGSGDCRKSVDAGGVMCPSYRATKNEKDSTRGRANALRDLLTYPTRNKNIFNHSDLKKVLDLCLSCKACARECPSSVDIAVLKAEFEYQYKKDNPHRLRTKLFAYNNTANRFARKFIGLANYSFRNKILSSLLKKTLKITNQRSLPILSKISLESWYAKHIEKLQPKNPIKTIYFFADEYTNQLDTQIGIDAIKLLTKLNYKVILLKHKESGRSFISKGYLEQAKKVADTNINIFEKYIDADSPLIGIEPSAILTFRDEYLRLSSHPEKAKKVSNYVFLIDEFLHSEYIKGNIHSHYFTNEVKNIKLHLHCHQKALSNIRDTFEILNIPENYCTTIIPSGCCGMAGAFGYEKEHYKISMKIGEQTLFPAIRKADRATIIAATGTSCRHQIFDGTERIALHPISILRKVLNS